MFEGLQDKLQGVFRRLKGEGRVSEEALAGAMWEIRIALLEADVHFRVVKSFVSKIRERALGESVLESLTAAQQVVKIVRDELIALLGEESQELRLQSHPAVILLCGLQGSGKTTTFSARRRWSSWCRWGRRRECRWSSRPQARTPGPSFVAPWSTLAAGAWTPRSSIRRGGCTSMRR